MNSYTERIILIGEDGLIEIESAAQAYPIRGSR
jgi:hypothetical protein